MNGKRPVGISILAIHRCFEAVAAIIAGVVLLAYPKISHVLDAYAFRARLLWALFAVVLAGLFYFWARGLWNLRNWARRLDIAIALIPLCLGTGFSGISPLLSIIPAGLVREIAGLALTVTVLIYLFSPRVRQAFGVNSASRSWQLAASVLCLVVIVVVAYKSKPEFEAYRWHRQHGDTVVINGVTFPVYKWDTPEEAYPGQTLRISGFENRGPLLQDEDSYFITVEGYNEKPGLMARERADEELRDYRNAGYSDVSETKLFVAKQTLVCARNTSYHRHSLFCYGDGPIYHVFFAGNEADLQRFNWMMASAR